MFSINNGFIYKLLYYLSGLIFPFFVCFISLKNFTIYKFNNIKHLNTKYISGIRLFILTVIILISLATLISSYISTNIQILSDLLISNNRELFNFEINIQIFITLITAILLLFNKLKLLIKKISLISFIVTSFIIWYSLINNLSITNIFYITNYLKFININTINILFLFSIEIVFFFWSYISNNSYLSDWNVPLPRKSEIDPIFNIIFFYFMVIIYYLILSN